MSDIRELLAERQTTHGDYEDHASITQKLKDAMREHPGWDDLVSSEREALEMIAHKIGRILSGNPHYNDHWADIAGYSTLVADLW